MPARKAKLSSRRQLTPSDDERSARTVSSSASPSRPQPTANKLKTQVNQAAFDAGLDWDVFSAKADEFELQMKLPSLNDKGEVEHSPVAIDLKPRRFSGGSFGWSASQNIPLMVDSDEDVNGKPCFNLTCSLSFNITVQRSAATDGPGANANKVRVEVKAKKEKVEYVSEEEADNAEENDVKKVKVKDAPTDEPLEEGDEEEVEEEPQVKPEPEGKEPSTDSVIKTDDLVAKESDDDERATATGPDGASSSSDELEVIEAPSNKNKRPAKDVAKLKIRQTNKPPPSKAKSSKASESKMSEKWGANDDAKGEKLRGGAKKEKENLPVKITRRKAAEAEGSPPEKKKRTSPRNASGSKR